MGAVLQRVASASVTVDGAVISEISRGLMVLVGIGTDDTIANIEVLTNKILQIHVFDDPATGSMWKQSAKDINGDVLCVSQFMLFANTHKGNKPDFHRTTATHLYQKSKEIYALFLERMGKIYKPEKIKGQPAHGKFGAMMNVSLTNEVRD
ncbi:D-tyrosyl-tRNA deacylase [Thelephora ganbajun]|uniref:D-tyrosyl-tRNA deacylase n=1 Tax=Thelephora ganbajun TaxID=370292 RepID=A0ACB6Z026_THEGA|nr:D-tyrosyl-tRNA deacylase [Thelephora ganbajun]